MHCDLTVLDALDGLGAILFLVVPESLPGPDEYPARPIPHLQLCHSVTTRYFLVAIPL